MFPFSNRIAWYRTGYGGHLVAIAGKARPYLDAGARATLDLRVAAYKRWARVRVVIVALLVVGTAIAISGGVLAWLRLTDVSGFVAGTAAAFAGVFTVALALVTRTIHRIEADIWGLMALQALAHSAQPAVRGRSPQP